MPLRSINRLTRLLGFFILICTLLWSFQLPREVSCERPVRAGGREGVEKRKKKRREKRGRKNTFPQLVTSVTSATYNLLRYLHTAALLMKRDETTSSICRPVFVTSPSVGFLHLGQRSILQWVTRLLGTGLTATERRKTNSSYTLPTLGVANVLRWSGPSHQRSTAFRVNRPTAGET